MPTAGDVIPESFAEVRHWLQGLHDDLQGAEDVTGFTPEQLAAFRVLFQAVLSPTATRRAKQRELDSAHAAIISLLQENLPGTRRDIARPVRTLKR